MKEHDDLFEFGDFEDDDALEIDLDELFSDLETLSLDPSAPAPRPAQAAPAAAPRPSAPGAPAPKPLAVPSAVVEPQVLVSQAAPKRFNKTSAAIAVAAIVTLANIAVIASPTFRSSQPDPRPPVAQLEAPPLQVLAPTVDPALQARIEQLEAQLRERNTQPVVRSSSSDRHRAFDDIEANLAAGEYVAARQRIYSLLGIVDRYGAIERERLEELASYLLADSYRLEALGLADGAGEVQL